MVITCIKLSNDNVYEFIMISGVKIESWFVLSANHFIQTKRNKGGILSDVLQHEDCPILMNLYTTIETCKSYYDIVPQQ